MVLFNCAFFVRSRTKKIGRRPGSDKPLEKTSFYTKVGDQTCGVGSYKE